MKDDDRNSSNIDIWTVIFDGFCEALKMIFSVVVAFTAASSKTTSTSTDDKTLHAGYRHNDDKTVHFDNDA